MRTTCLLSLLSAAALAVAIPASAPRAEGLEAEPVVGGIQMGCTDFRGLVVRTTQLTDLGDVASARIMGRMPVILLDPDRMAKLPAKLQLFFYAHECAHHVLGHSFAQTTSSENEADCWSIKHGRDRGIFTRDDVAAFAPHFAHSKGSPIGHLPGPQRAERLLTCFDDPTDELAEPQARQAPGMLSASTGG